MKLYMMLGMLYLYFPEDKSEYIPAAMSFFIFMVFCVLTFRWIVKHSKKEAEKAKLLEEKLKLQQAAEQENKPL